MKKFITLFICLFIIVILEGCAQRFNNVAPPPKKKPREIVTGSLYPFPEVMFVAENFKTTSLTPVSYTTKDRCNEVFFFSAIVTPTSGYHGLVGISMSETKIGDEYICKYFGSAVVYQIKQEPYVKEIITYEDDEQKNVPAQRD